MVAIYIIMGFVFVCILGEAICDVIEAVRASRTRRKKRQEDFLADEYDLDD